MVNLKRIICASILVMIKKIKKFFEYFKKIFKKNESKPNDNYPLW